MGRKMQSGVNASACVLFMSEVVEFTGLNHWDFELHPSQLRWNSRQSPGGVSSGEVLKCAESSCVTWRHITSSQLSDMMWSRFQHFLHQPVCKYSSRVCLICQSLKQTRWRQTVQTFYPQKCFSNDQSAFLQDEVQLDMLTQCVAGPQEWWMPGIILYSLPRWRYSVKILHFQLTQSFTTLIMSRLPERLSLKCFSVYISVFLFHFQSESTNTTVKKVENLLQQTSFFMLKTKVFVIPSKLQIISVSRWDDSLPGCRWWQIADKCAVALCESWIAAGLVPSRSRTARLGSHNAERHMWSPAVSKTSRPSCEKMCCLILFKRKTRFANKSHLMPQEKHTHTHTQLHECILMFLYYKT